MTMQAAGPLVLEPLTQAISIVAAVLYFNSIAQRCSQAVRHKRDKGRRCLTYNLIDGFSVVAFGFFSSVTLSLQSSFFS